jgi:15-cis-phytoene synthase
VTDHCRALVAADDKDRYLGSLYASEAARPHLFALYAFDLELTRIPRLVREPMIGEIRLQWWRDTVSSIFEGELQEHPVALALAEAVQSAQLPEAALQQMIDGRSEELAGEGDDMEAWLGKIFSLPIQLASLLLGQSQPETAGLAGVAYGVARRLMDRSLTDPDGAQMAELANRRLAEARRLALPQEALPAFLHVSLADLYLRASARGKNDVPLLRRQFHIWRAARANRF